MGNRRVRLIVQKEEISNVDENKNVLSKTVKTLKYHKPSYKFGCCMLDTDWELKLNNIGEFHTLFAMLKLENQVDGEVHLSEKNKKKIAEKLSVSLSQVNKNIKGLSDAGLIARVDRATYRINPDCLFKGGTNTLPEKYEEFTQYLNPIEEI